MSSTVLGPADVRTRLLPRFIAFGLVVLLAVTILGARLFWLQVARGGEYAGLAAENAVDLQPVRSARGLIVARNGRAVVENVPSFAVKIRPADLPFSRRPAVVARLAQLLGMTPTEINETIDRNPGSRFDQVRIRGDLDPDVARVISEEHLDLPGVEVTVDARRRYPEGALLSQVIGYTGAVSQEDLDSFGGDEYLTDDIIGRTGVEAVYEDQLRGSYGIEQVERDAGGRMIRVLREVRPPVPGNTLELSIDLRTQREAQRALRWAMRLAGFDRGAVIVMNPQTGEVLALVSLPTYDDNKFAQGISQKDFQALLKDPAHPLVNHAISEQYPPGSTYKIVTGTGVLADGKIDATTRVTTLPYLTLGSTKFYEWNGRGWGALDIYNGFGHSSDTFFYQMAAKLGIDRLAYWADQYGFGRPTGIDLPAEASGIVPSNDWKIGTLGQEIFPGETYQAGIGQGYDAATPIQVLNAYNALANGGRLLRPQVVRRVLAPDGSVVRPFKPDLIHRLDVDPGVLRTMRLAARRVVTIRHTYNLADLPIVVAGKSGTAEFGERDPQGRLPFHSWFAAFVPKEGDPAKHDAELAVLAFAHDSRTKGNVATEIVKYFLQLHYGVKKDFRLPDLVVRDNFYGSQSGN